MNGNRLETYERPTLQDRRDRASLLRSVLFLDAGMWVFPNLTLRLLNWAEPDLAQIMARDYP